MCETREDALFELLYWVEDDMERVVRRMDVVGAVKGGGREKSREQGEKKDSGQFGGRKGERGNTVDDEFVEHEDGEYVKRSYRKRAGEELDSDHEEKRARFSDVDMLD